MENTSTSAFARLLATENIRVCHSAEAQTASFDVVDRVLTLPRWKDMSSNLYDMLIGHEVAHALWTPGDLAEDGVHLAAAVEIDPENPMRAMGFLNVIEDARIERLIKDKYPGIRRDFVLGYRWLWENMDLFQTVIEENGGISKMMLADRLNLHFKLGVLGHITVPFSHDERPFVERMEAATSWDDVMDITRDLYEHAKEETRNQTPQEVQTGEGDEGGDEKGTVKSPMTDQVLGSGLDELRDHRYRGSAADRVDVLPTPDLDEIIVSADEIDELITIGDVRYTTTTGDFATKIEEGFDDFDVVIATPDMMPTVGRLGRVLGPSGKMPNPKVGTVTDDVEKAVSESKAGKIEYRTDRQAIVHLAIGKASFDADKLLENYAAVMEEITKAKPASTKGRYIISVSVSTTMGPGIAIDPTLGTEAEILPDSSASAANGSAPPEPVDAELADEESSDSEEPAAA